MQILDEYMAGWNAKDTARWGRTFHVPHYRLASGRMAVLAKPGMQPAGLWERMKAGLGSYESLSILTFENGRWGVTMRSSFAQ